ncbi:hypothetical protein F6Y02_43660, partial [Bacillus megaterium]|nr:hypothetical protein [Priestia megaterium]
LATGIAVLLSSISPSVPGTIGTPACFIVSLATAFAPFYGWLLLFDQ